MKLKRLDKRKSGQIVCTESCVGKSTINEWGRNTSSLYGKFTQVETKK